jgi:hypothetical protein
VDLEEAIALGVSPLAISERAVLSDIDLRDGHGVHTWQLPVHRKMLNR